MATTVSSEKIENDNEPNMFRNASVENSTPVTITKSAQGDQHVYSVTHSSGSTFTMANQATYMFNPNNYQTLTNGEEFHTVKGYCGLHVTGDYEVRTIQDVVFTTGVNEIYTKKGDENPQNVIVKESGKIASYKVSPYKATGGYSNNTLGSIPMKGSVDPKSGSTQGQNPPPLMSAEDKQKLIEARASDMAKAEVQLGEGGSIIFNSGKHLQFTAGTAAAAFDSGFINPVGRKVSNGMQYDTEKKALVEKFTAVPTFQERDTFSHMPFGNITFNGNSRITMNAGAGGIVLAGAGQMKMMGTGLTHIAGQQLNLVGIGTTNIDTKALEINASGVTNISSPETHIVGNTNIVGNLHVLGDLVVDGNITCTGNVQVNGNTNVDGTMHSAGNITSDADIIASGISLVNHVHPQNNGNDAGGGVDTSVPK